MPVVRRPFLAPVVVATAILALVFVGALTTEPVVAKPPTLRAHPNLAPFRGVGAWIDIYDTRSWRHPRRVVHDLAAHGVRTIYLQTGNDARPRPIVNPRGTAEFLDAAHTAGLDVVGWYLPGFVDPATDLQRVQDAIGFTTPAGNRFDGFGLDIESAAVRNVRTRTSRLLKLSDAIRAVAGPTYPLGAITPSPHGMVVHRRYWPRFPYRGLALRYDALLPMVYFTWRDTAVIDSQDYVALSLEILRAGVGSGGVPIHVIGGIAQDASTAGVRGFAAAVGSGVVIGDSLYSYRGVTPKMWNLLAPAPRG
jgi:hypothetical protein